MYRKRAYIIFGTLLLVGIFGATGVYVYFSTYMFIFFAVVACPTDRCIGFVVK